MTGPIRPLAQPRLGLAVVVLLLGLQGEAAGRSALEAWDNLCEECHGEASVFAGKYLWQIDGLLQGRHHVDDLHLFMGNHYIPDHEIDAMRKMLASLANTKARFNQQCGECHGDPVEFVDKSIWVRKQGMTALGAGIEVEEFLGSHRDIPAQDIDYYLRLFVRLARNQQ